MPRFLLLIFLSTLLGCHSNRKVHPSAYYWQTVFKLSAAETDKLKQSGIEKLYVRFFDVVYNVESGLPQPVADIRFDENVDSSLQIVPVVFIRNTVLQQLKREKCKDLAQKICKRINGHIVANQLKPNTEIQLDCDWTYSTKEKFFELVNECKALQPDKRISCTIRLHQVKYYKSIGVPPCDRGMLMFYNMGSLKADEKCNSIYDADVARSYLVNFDSYPLPLDVAVPLFSMAVLYRNDKPINTVSENLTTTALMKPLSPTTFEATKDTFAELFHIRKGDILKVEKAKIDDCRTAAKQIAPYLTNTDLTVCIFDLNPSFFNHDTTALRQIYSSFK